MAWGKSRKCLRDWMSRRHSGEKTKLFCKNQKAADKIVNSFLYDPYGIRTRVTAVKGRCLNRLTNGPCMAEKEGFEPSHRLPDLHP